MRTIGATLAATATTLALALTATLTGAGIGAASAREAVARVPSHVVVDDGSRPDRAQRVNDIVEVAAYSATSREPAVLRVMFADVPSHEVELWTYFNFDGDSQPEAAMIAGGNHYRLVKMRSWTKIGRDLDLNCGKPSASLSDVSFEFSPVCMGGKRHGTMAVSVVAKHPTSRTEYVPGRHKWSRKIRTWS